MFWLDAVGPGPATADVAVDLACEPLSVLELEILFGLVDHHGAAGVTERITFELVHQLNF